MEMWVAFMVCLASIYNVGWCMEEKCRFFETPDMSLKVVLSSKDYNPDSFLDLNCNLNSPPSIYDSLQNCSYPNVNHVRFELCSFENATLSNIFAKIGINTSQVEFIHIVESRGIEQMSSTFLDGLNNLKTFMLSGGLKAVDSQAFLPTPSLVTLSLAQNSFQSLPVDAFDGLLQLENLQLRSNKLTGLPEEILFNLPQLQLLYLHSNNIDHLSEQLISRLHLLRVFVAFGNTIGNLSESFFINNTLLENIQLNRNRITHIPASLFSHLNRLQSLEMKSNDVESIESDALLNCTQLRKLILSHNNIRRLSPAIFESLHSLEELMLSENLIADLTEEMFHPMKSLKKLDLSDNLLVNLPEFLLSEASNLTELNFKGNQISVLPLALLNKTLKLVEVNFENNSLATIPDRYFWKTNTLKKAILSHNRLQSIGVDSFPRSLTTLELSNCSLTNDIIGKRTPFFNSLLQLVHIDLSYNRLNDTPYSLSLVHLTTMKLRGNMITSFRMTEVSYFNKGFHLDLSDNHVQLIHVNSYDQVNYEVSIDVSGNPFVCDCNLYMFTKLVQGMITQSYPHLKFINKRKIMCHSPTQLVNRSVVSIKLEELVCESKASEKGCSAICDCTSVPHTSTVWLNCSSRSLTKIPHYTKLNIHAYKKYIIDLSSNDFSTIDLSNTSAYQLILSHNNITTDGLENITGISPTLKLLNLSYNKFNNLPESFMKLLNKSNIAFDLTGNSWTCDCQLKKFHHFVQTSFEKFVNVRELRCNGYNTALIDMTADDVCISTAYITLLTALPVVAFLIAIIATVVLINYKNMIVVWLYSHRMCLWLITEDEVDSDKEYDAFISFAHQDDHFVDNYLVPGLERREPPFKVCIHKRDWIGGALIQTQILNSVKNSRRTIVVLSKHFVKSAWGQSEFRSAYEQTMQDKTNRVILVVFGEIPDDKDLTDELRHYIKLHTYIKYDNNPRFWQQLLFAMPHPKQMPRNKTSQAMRMEPIRY